jgi:transposase-like protein
MGKPRKYVISDEVKRRIIKRVIEDKRGWKETALCFGISLSTVNRIIREHKSALQT